jgi:predicted dehydrogenase
MSNKINRRNFVKTTAFAGIGLGLTSGFTTFENSAIDGRIGIIGLDTSHSIAFVKALNAPDASPLLSGFKVVAAYPKGSSEIKSSYERIPAYTEEVKKLGVEIVNSIDELLPKVDYVLLETNDGRLHLEQALPVLKAGKRMFIDKPIAASLTDAIAIFNAAEKYKVPVFSSSSLRYISGIKEISEGKIGKVIGADTFSPCHLEATHPDLVWYGIHGVEILFTVMGTGCKSVTRVSTPDSDMSIGIWNDNRIGSFRGTRTGKSEYGGFVFGEKGNFALSNFGGYDPLLFNIIEFFKTGIVPVSKEETLEIFAFMMAADESKKKRGKPVNIELVMQNAIKEAKKMQN